jgi:transcriptional regulator with XRE-family HTH domain
MSNLWYKHITNVRQKSRKIYKCLKQMNTHAQTTAAQRILELAKMLTNGSISELADKLHVNYTALHPYIQGKRNPGEKMLNRFYAIGVNPDWVRSGRGAVFLVSDDSGEKHQVFAPNIVRTAFTPDVEKVEIFVPKGFEIRVNMIPKQ